MEFVSRETWGHPDPGDPGGNFLGVQRQKWLVQHHTPGQDPTSYNEALEELAQIYASHRGQGWQDIGYNFLIWDRFCFEGRGFGYTGAHAPGANSISLGVAFIFDGRFRIPTPTEYETFHELAEAAITYGYLLDPYQLTGHRDWVSTECPGQLCYDHLGDYWLWHPGTPTPQPTPSEEFDVYDFEQRPGGPFPWKLNNIDYGPFGGAIAMDFVDVEVGDRIVVSPTHPDVGEVVCNLFYPSAKQTEAKAVRFGHPVQWVAEEAGFVTLLASKNAAARLRVIGRA